MTKLLFVDTNIMLDFYRVQAREGGLSILKLLDSNRSSVITTAQVEMEFKKNRQSVITEAIKALKPPQWTSMALPPVLADGPLKTSIAKAEKTSKALGQNAIARIESLFNNPARTDPVYKVLQRLFRTTSPYNLSATDDIERIQSVALRRFALGFPPRKQSDTSCGDAVNWEWIIDCATRSSNDIVIVSRDTDYGIVQKDESFLNDWLLDEFRRRVGGKRTIALTNRLTDGFKRANVAVTRAQEEAEQSAIDTRPSEIVSVPIQKSSAEILDELRMIVERTARTIASFKEPNMH